MTYLIESSEIKTFYVWINPNDLIANHNSEIGSFFSMPQGNNNDHLMFIPNPDFKGGVSPFQANLLGSYIEEYNLEQHRMWYFNTYPSRLGAIFLFESEEDAKAYRKRNLDHVGKRVLKITESVGDYIYSKHDSSWIDFLRLPGWKDKDMIFNTCQAYWEGKRVIDCDLEHFGKKWSEDPIWEILFNGKILFK